MAALGEPLHLFDAATLPAEMRNSVVLAADRGAMQKQDSKSAAFAAARRVMLRDIGPINAPYFAAADKPLPVSNFGPAPEAMAPLLQPVRMLQRIMP